MIMGAIQRYIILGLLGVILVNAGYSAYLWISRDNLNDRIVKVDQDRKDAIRETEVAKAETESTKRSLDQTRAELEAARVAIATREKEIDSINKAKEASDARLQKALNGSRDWSDTPVPASVRDALRKTD